MSNFEEDNISRLKFIGKIKKGEKINIKDMVVQPNNVYTKIHRSFVIVDNRNNTLSFIFDTVKKSFEELINHLNKSQTNLFDLNISTNMIQDLENCKIGLVNLKDTYLDDLMFCCKVDTINQDIDARLEEIKSNYTFIKQKSNPINIPNKNMSSQQLTLQATPTTNPMPTPNPSPQLEPGSYPDSLPSSLSSIDSIPSVLTSKLYNNKNKN
jgi:hypothetical protein